MDIERLNKIREICFNKSKSRGRGTGKRNQQPYQANKVRSPFAKVPKSHSRGKENEDSLTRAQTTTGLNLQNMRAAIGGHILKTMEREVIELYEKK